MREMKVEIGDGTKMKCEVRYEEGQVVGKTSVHFACSPG